MYYQNLELEFPILEAVQIKGVVFTDLGNAWNLEKLYCNAALASPHDVTNPCFSAERLLDVRTSWDWAPVVLPARTAALRVGLPCFKRLLYEETCRPRVLHRQPSEPCLGQRAQQDAGAPRGADGAGAGCRAGPRPRASWMARSGRLGAAGGGGSAPGGSP